jgi:hypothetical protein
MQGTVTINNSTNYTQLSTDTTIGNRPLQLVGSATGTRFIRADSQPAIGATNYFLTASPGNVVAIVADPTKLWAYGTTGTASWMVAT